MNKRGKAIDTTCLSLDHAEQRGFIHRDYLAHCLRWSHVVKYLMQQHRYKTHQVLDIGCGREAPLAKLLYSSRMTHTTGSYTGVDYGKLERPASIPDTKKFKARFLGNFDFAEDWAVGDGVKNQFDTVVCFEMLEHVEPFHSFRTLQKINEVLKNAGSAFLSTPCYDPKMGAADNHVNEMSWMGLRLLIGLAGLDVIDCYGTFASQKDYKHKMDASQKDVFERLSQYYDSNVLACFMAPMFPSEARNCLWHVKRGLGPTVHGNIKELLKPEHSSSSHWARDVKRLLKENE